MTRRQIAIVGAGPSGCYLAQALLKAQPDLQIDLVDRLPVPYGLVRYGVAADHQGTKGVTRQFARIFERQGARFFGNIEIGQHVSLDDLRGAYDAVVIAAGLSKDRRLGIPGDNLPGVYGAGALTRALYEHPDADDLPALGSHPLIVGNGNVAIDLLRLLAKTTDELVGSDLGASITGWLSASGIQDITIIGRSPAAKAKFDVVMIKELAKLAGVTIHVIDAGASEVSEEQKKVDAVAALDGLSTGPRRVTFRFGLTPASVNGGDHASSVTFDAAEGAETIACTSVVTAIGFDPAGDLPRDALLSAATDAGAGRLEPGLYATGWFRRGPRGTIPDNRADAQALAAKIVGDLDAQGADHSKAGSEVLAQVPEVTDYASWSRIDAAETADPPPGRCRAKIATREEMLTFARKEETSW